MTWQAWEEVGFAGILALCSGKVELFLNPFHKRVDTGGISRNAQILFLPIFVMLFAFYSEYLIVSCNKSLSLPCNSKFNRGADNWFQWQNSFDRIFTSYYKLHISSRTDFLLRKKLTSILFFGRGHSLATSITPETCFWQVIMRLILNANLLVNFTFLLP